MFVSPSLLSISVYFILSFRMKAVNLSTAHALNGFLIINLKLSYKQQWREKIPEAHCKIRLSLQKHARYDHEDFFLKKTFFFMIFGSFWAYDFMIHHWEWIFYCCISAWTVQGDCSAELLNQLLICLAVALGGCSCTALCCCAQSLLIRSDNLNEQSSKWRTEEKYCWQTRSASCAIPSPNSV